MGKWRTEHDSLGKVEVPAERYWGAQTQRAIAHFPAGGERLRWGRPVLRALGLIKLAAARTHADLGVLPRDVANFIAAAAAEVADGKFDTEFPLPIFHSGSGTQTNMNANEVVANRANELAGGSRGTYVPVHPNDHVNLSQSSNDVFPTVMHMATVEDLTEKLLPALRRLRDTLRAKAQAHEDIVMLGRTHLQDATPITLAQAIRGWVTQLDEAGATIERALPELHEVALGGTAVGTGMNSDVRFAPATVRRLAELTGQPFRPAGNKFTALSSHDAIVNTSAGLRTLAGALMKLANDVRWYASGPRAGLGELLIPANEPGSSIMPGKVNPSQAEALSQVAVHVYGNDAAIAFAGSQGAFQLNVFKPVMLHNLLESIDLLAAAIDAFDRYCARGLEANRPIIARHVQESIMLATALTPHIGYERAARIALRAQQEGISLREAALGPDGITAAQFDAWVHPEEMTGPGTGQD
ncbi:MAG: class II fumarate hydratase [Thermoleophilia bacterium]